MSMGNWRGSGQGVSQHKPVRKIVRDEMLDARIAAKRLARQESARSQKIRNAGSLKKRGLGDPRG